MRTFKILLVCLFVGFGITHLFAQDPVPPGNKPGTGSVHFYEGLPEEYPVEIPVICGGDEINLLVGTAMVGFGRVLFKGGFPIHQNSWYKWDFIGNGDEKFKGQDHWKYVWDGDTGRGQVNLIGDKGTHYILSYTWEAGVATQEIRCPGSK
jgi:hypothetical protein